MQKLNFLFFIVISLSLYRCAPYGRDRYYEPNNDLTYTWVAGYKLRVYCHCLDAAYGHDSITAFKKQHEHIMLSGDNYIFYYKELKNIGRTAGEKIPYSEWFDFDAANIEMRKRITANCLALYASRELDSIAKKKYKEYEKDSKALEKMFSKKSKRFNP